MICSDSNILSEQSTKFTFSKLQRNTLYEITDDCTIDMTPLEKRLEVSRKPKRGYNHIFEEEVFESVDAMSSVSDDGAKFISDHQVVLGGFERAKEELKLVQNLVIAANGTSFIAAEYGAMIMRHLGCFNSIKVLEGADNHRRQLENMRYAGLLTLSQSGHSKDLIEGIISAYKLGVSCFNVVNVEDSPITRVIQEVDVDEGEAQFPYEKRRLMRSDSGQLETLALNRANSTLPSAVLYENDENIGFYMKSGFCYSDIKSFVPEILALALVGIWFSDKKTTVIDKEVRRKRKALIRDIELLPERVNMALADENLELY